MPNIDLEGLKLFHTALQGHAQNLKSLKNPNIDDPMSIMAIQHVSGFLWGNADLFSPCTLVTKEQLMKDIDPRDFRETLTKAARPYKKNNRDMVALLFYGMCLTLG